MSYLSKTLILLTLSAYAIFMDYMEEPEKYAVVTSLFSSKEYAFLDENQYQGSQEELSQEEMNSINEFLKEFDENRKALNNAIENSKSGDKRLSLKYDLIRDSINTENVEVKAQITNHSNKDIYYYSSSCHGLKDLFTMKPELTYGRIEICGIENPKKGVIKAKSTLEYNFSKYITEDIKRLQFDLNLIEIYSDADLTTSHYLLEKHIKQGFLLRGKPTEIQKIKG